MFNPKEFIENVDFELKRKVKNDKVISACSGGVDSMTCTVMAHRALNDKLIAVFIDDGFRRIGEPEGVIKVLGDLGIKNRLVRVEKEFIKALNGKIDAEEKRIAFREKFYSVLGRLAKEEKARYLLQGTIAADIVETDAGIKTQHNVLEQIGINPEKYGFKVIEPLKELYKPQVRMVARELRLTKEISERMPFPGPALSIRVIGEVTPERIELVRKATKIVEDETKHLNAFQSFAVLHSDKATGIKNGKRVYGNIVTIRIVESEDAITAKSMKIKHKTLMTISEKITSELPSVVRCLFDITNKPPATIEFE